MFLLHNAFRKTILRRQTANTKRPLLRHTVRAARLGNNSSPEVPLRLSARKPKSTSLKFRK